MTKKEIFDIEQTLFNRAILYKEGAFWVAYERSAFLFCRHVRPFRPTKKVVKSAGGELVSIGFPDQAWMQLTPMAVFVEKNDKRIVIEVKPEETSEDEFIHNFDKWKESIDVVDPRAKKTATHENLPVYKATYDLTIKIFKQSQHLQKNFRYTLGEKIKEELIDLLTAVYSANMADEKEPYIKEARRLIEVIRVQLRLLHDLGQIAVKNMASINLNIEEIAKQLSAWYNSTIKKEKDMA